MVLVPEDYQLELDVMILNKDVGFVLPGQAVEVKVDSFPYTRFGTLSGEVNMFPVMQWKINNGDWYFQRVSVYSAIP